MGGVSLYDPQTGHYFAEIPVAPAMLKAPDVLTGSENAITGFNSSVGTIAYGWRPVEQRGELTLSAGQYGFDGESIYQGVVLPGKSGGTQVAADAEWARSQSDGAIPYGDHNFQRISGRVQLQGAAGQTDFFAGYQHKFFGWPDLYTPFGVNETENLQTVLVVANHRWQDKAGRLVRSRRVHYRLQSRRLRIRPAGSRGSSIPTSTPPGSLACAAVHGFVQLVDFGLNYSIAYLHDDIESTSLVFGPYNDRSMFKIAVEPEKSFKLSEGELLLRGGLAYDDSDHGKSALSPVALVQWQAPSGKKFYFEYSEATQLPTYTALKSSPTGGLFRGNQNLGRETSRNLEAGAAAKAGAWNFNGAIFYRWDDDLVDWTYTQSVPAARSANAVDVGVAGVELLATAWHVPVPANLCSGTPGCTRTPITAPRPSMPVSTRSTFPNIASPRL